MTVMPLTAFLLMRLSLAALLSLLMLQSILSQSPECTELFWNPGADGVSSAKYGIGGVGSRADLYAVSIILPHSVQVTALNIYPWWRQLGVLNVSAAVFTALQPRTTNQSAVKLAQTAVHTVIDPSFNANSSLIPLQLPVSPPVVLSAGRYSLVWWWTWNASSDSLPYPQFTTYYNCTAHLELFRLDLPSFSESSGVLPLAFTNTSFLSVFSSPLGVLGSLATNSCWSPPVLPSSSSSSSTASSAVLPSYSSSSVALPFVSWSSSSSSAQSAAVERGAGVSAGAVVGIVLSILCTVCLLFLVLYCTVLRRWRRRKLEQDAAGADLSYLPMSDAQQQTGSKRSQRQWNAVEL
jgi:hypothetical protein